VTDGAEANWRRIIEAFDRHGVEYLIVGGVGARLHGAQRLTTDFDSLPNSDRSNLERLASAMRELGAFLRVDGLTDDESKALPTPLDGLLLANMDISTWRTDAGDLDVLTAIPTRSGGRATYTDIVDRAASVDFAGVRVLVAALADIIASKEWADRPKDREALIELRALRDDEPQP